MAAEHLALLRELRSIRPFCPVRIVTTSGQEYTLHDRLQFAVAERFVLLYPDAEPGRAVDLRPEQIAAVEQMKEKPAA